MFDRFTRVGHVFDVRWKIHITRSRKKSLVNTSWTGDHTFELPRVVNVLREAWGMAGCGECI